MSACINLEYMKITQPTAEHKLTEMSVLTTKVHAHWFFDNNSPKNVRCKHQPVIVCFIYECVWVCVCAFAFTKWTDTLLAYLWFHAMPQWCGHRPTILRIFCVGMHNSHIHTRTEKIEKFVWIMEVLINRKNICVLFVNECLYVFFSSFRSSNRHCHELWLSFIEIYRT